jgi:hypothetical protein
LLRRIADLLIAIEYSLIAFQSRLQFIKLIIDFSSQYRTKLAKRYIERVS